MNPIPGRVTIALSQARFLGERVHARAFLDRPVRSHAPQIDKTEPTTSAAQLLIVISLPARSNRNNGRSRRCPFSTVSAGDSAGLSRPGSPEPMCRGMATARYQHKRRPAGFGTGRIGGNFRPVGVDDSGVAPSNR